MLIILPIASAISADETVKPESGRIVYDGISSTEKQLVWLDQSRHVATLDMERHLIADAMLGHLAANAPA